MSLINFNKETVQKTVDELAITAQQIMDSKI